MEVQESVEYESDDSYNSTCSPVQSRKLQNVDDSNAASESEKMLFTPNCEKQLPDC